MNDSHRAPLLKIGLLVLAMGLMASAASAEWLDDGWNQRLRLAVRHQRLSPTETFSDVTLLLQLNSSLDSVFAAAKPDGSDLVITKADGVTPLPLELVSYDALGEEAELWFRADSLSVEHDTFFLYFDNADTSIVNGPQSAWSDAHVAVYHFEDDPTQGVLTDSGPNGHNAVTGATGTWSASDRAEGAVGNGWHLDGTSHWIYADNVTAADSSFTITAWMADSFDTAPGSLAFQSESGFWNASFQRSPDVQEVDMETFNGFMTWGPVANASQLHQYTWIFDAEADTARFFLDGVEREPRLVYLSFPPKPVYTGEAIDGRIGIAGPVFFNGLDLTSGLVDEYRVVEGVLSSDCVTMLYENQSNPGAFFEYLIQENNVVTGIGDSSAGTASFGRIAAWPSPFQARAEITAENVGADTRIGVYDVAGRLVRTLRAESVDGSTVRMSWNGRDQQGMRVGAGVYYVRAMDERATQGTKLLYVR